MSELVTICIPVYNNEATISETLDSLLSQTYKNLKIKVFDNASTDSTQEILKSYRDKYKNIELIIGEENIGGEANFTKCIQGGEGVYTAVFHADDKYLPTIVEEQVNFLNSNQDCAAVATHAYIIDGRGMREGERPVPEELAHNVENKLTFENIFHLTLKYANFITCPSVMARTNIYKNQIQVWNGSRFKSSADLDVWLRLAQEGSFGFISKPLMEYRSSVDSYSYRMERLCCRMEKLDLFLVLDYYIDNNLIHVNKDNQNLYNALLFLDNLYVNVNKYLNNRRDFQKNIDLSFSFSKRIMRYKVLNFLFNVVKYIPAPDRVKLLLKRVKGKV